MSDIQPADVSTDSVSAEDPSPCIRVTVRGDGTTEVDGTELDRYFAAHPEAQERFLTQWELFVSACLRLADRSKSQSTQGDDTLP